ncbi:hypothetical protein D9611_000896 [Ephemerocybe angulata]|uniref:Microbial-type PARG catalytic domain-containing protein n=1 Tax=Ephemerocybe angulata TaxID=980116 RepID=A0A8H5F766_9AGAR|nr:hypothetical protein D9611_000896 [Tulosesus angulatus]
MLPVVDTVASLLTSAAEAIGLASGPSSSKSKTMSDKGNGKKPTKDVEEIRSQREGNSSRHPEKWSPLYDSAPSRREEKPRDRRKRVAELTLRALNRGSYEYRSATISLGIKETVEGTIFFEENYPLNDWKSVPHRDTQRAAEATVSILNISTLDAARILHNSYRFAPQDGSAPPKTGVLNFASATQPGGGFENGAEAQEESIARVSTLSRSLKSKEGKRFYEVHKKHKSPFYTHTMIFSPDVIVFHNDQGEGVDPMPIQVVSSAAVNAGLILENKATFLTAQAEVEIEAAMEERMGRILYLFETRGIRNIVLGTFGTGVFKNKVDMVARVWAKLLVGGRFTFSFDRVFFAVTGDTTFATFKGSWEGWEKTGRNTH